MADGKHTSYDAAIGWTLLLLFLFCVIAFFWYLKGDSIASVIRWVRVGEMELAQVFVGPDYMIKVDGKETYRLADYIDLAKKISPNALNQESKLGHTYLGLIAIAAMQPLRYAYSIILFIAAFWAIYRGPKSRYRNKLDLNKLIERQSTPFPALSPFVTFNPANQPHRPPGAPVPAELPAFAEALGPEEWVAYFDVPVPDGKLDQDGATRALAKQLGAPWRGPMHMEPYRQVLLAALCLKSIRKRADADTMLGELSKCWNFDKGLKIDPKLLQNARRILKDRSISGKILSRCNQHAYENTALMRALATAREEGGVMAPAQFVWMRGFDRTLWYPLNNLGRQSYHMEALGAMCHYKAEKMAARPIPRPKVEDAVKSLAEYLSSSNARPIPPLDYSKSKKRAIKKVKGT